MSNILTEKENLVPLFKHRRKNCNVVLPDGTLIMFANGIYFTEDKRIQRALQQLVDNGEEGGVYIDPAQPEIDTLAATPMEQQRKQIRKELLEELRRNGMLVGGDTVVGVTSSIGANANQAKEPATSLPESVLPPVVVGQDGSVAKDDDGKQLTGLDRLNKLKNQTP